MTKEPQYAFLENSHLLSVSEMWLGVLDSLTLAFLPLSCLTLLGLLLAETAGVVSLPLTFTILICLTRGVLCFICVSTLKSCSYCFMSFTGSHGRKLHSTKSRVCNHLVRNGIKRFLYYNKLP